jgi:outer membrane lipoprotein SlyB
MILKKLLKHDWKTTISGAITGAALGFVAYKTGNPEMYVAAAGAFATGLMGKDAVEGIKGKINA